MGEAKRRKKLDPNYGKRSRLNIFLMGDLAQKCYEQYGRGILFNMPGSAPRYVLSDCSWLIPSEIEKIEQYNPNTQVILAEFLAPKLASSSRATTTFSISKANELQVKSSCQTIDELVSKLFVACQANEPS